MLPTSSRFLQNIVFAFIEVVAWEKHIPVLFGLSNTHVSYYGVCAFVTSVPKYSLQTEQSNHQQIFEENLLFLWDEFCVKYVFVDYLKYPKKHIDLHKRFLPLLTTSIVGVNTLELLSQPCLPIT